MPMIAFTMGALAWLVMSGASSTAADLDPERAITRIAMGSCVRQDRPQPIWEAVAGYRPDVFLMLGDNIYGDTADMQVLRKKYASLAANAGFAAIRQAVPILAVSAGARLTLAIRDLAGTIVHEERVRLADVSPAVETP